MRPAVHILDVACGVLLLAGAPLGLGAQQGCRYADDGNDELVAVTVPGGGRVTYISNPHFLCEDGVEIWGDSAVAYSAQSMSQLIGNVRYRDRTRELTANEARYFSEVGRLQAQGRVRVTDSDDGSVIENGDLVYLRETDYRSEEEMTVTTGADGVRPRAQMRPARPDSLPPETDPGPPYTVEGDVIVIRGSTYFRSVGAVRIERDSLVAFGDSAEYQGSSEQLVLVGAARVESGAYTLVGRTITLGTSETEASEIHARRDGLLTGDDLVVTAPHIALHLADGVLERMVAVPLVLELETEPSAESPDSRGDSSDLARPVAIAESFELTADSLEVISAADVIERILAVGDARSVSRARDSLNVAVLPEIARSDWLEGDTVVISLVQVRDTVLGSDTTEAEYEVERIVARVGARSLYRLPPEDSAAVTGVDPPAVHYVVGNEITLIMENGEVRTMDVVGQTSGVHLEPLRITRDSLPDSAAAASDSASAANDFSFAGVGAGLAARLVDDAQLRAHFQPPARGRRPWIRR
jgi:lipopolysaccharide export system protein LptA